MAQPSDANRSHITHSLLCIHLVKLWFDDKLLRHTTFLPVQPGSSADPVSPPLESPISARDLMDVVISRRVARSYLKGQDTHTHEEDLSDVAARTAVVHVRCER